MFTLHYPELRQNFDEIDDFAYDVIYKKEFGPNTPKKLMREWRDGYNILTVRQDGGLLIAMGMLEIYKKQEDILRIEHVAVSPSFREYGLGSLVVGTLIDYATLAKAKEVRLRSVQDAVGFYQRCGFIEYNGMHDMRRTLR